MADTVPPQNLTWKTLPRFTKYQYIVVGSLTSVHVAAMAATGVVGPIFPQMAQAHGISTTMSGLVFSSFSLLVLITSPFMGQLCNKFGTKFILLSGILCQGVGNTLLGCADLMKSTIPFTAICFVSRVIEGTGAAAIYTASHAYAAKVFPANLNFIMGVLNIGIGVGCCLGPLFGGILYDVGGYQLPFYILGGFLLLMFPPNYFLISEGRDVNRSDSKPDSIWKILTIKPIILLGLALVVEGIAWDFIMATMSVQLVDQFNLTVSEVSLYFMVGTGTYVVSSLCWGHVSDLYMRHSWAIITVGLFLSSVAVLVIGPSPLLPFKSSLPISYAAVVLWGMGIGMSYTPTFGVIIYFLTGAKFESDEKQYSFLASYNWSMYSLGEFIAPAVGAFLVDRIGFPLTCTLVSLIILLMTLAMTVYFCFLYKLPTWENSEGSTDHPNLETSRLLH